MILVCINLLISDNGKTTAPTIHSHLSQPDNKLGTILCYLYDIILIRCIGSVTDKFIPMGVLDESNREQIAYVKERLF